MYNLNFNISLIDRFEGIKPQTPRKIKYPPPLGANRSRNIQDITVFVVNRQDAFFSIVICPHNK